MRSLRWRTKWGLAHQLSGTLRKTSPISSSWTPIGTRLASFERAERDLSNDAGLVQIDVDYVEIWNVFARVANLSNFLADGSDFVSLSNVRYKIVCLIYMYAFPFTGTILLFTGTGIKFWGPGKNSSYLGVVNVNLNGTGVVWKSRQRPFKRRRSHSNWRSPGRDMNCFRHGLENANS